LANNILELRNTEENVHRIALKSYSTQLKKQHEELINLDKNVLEFVPKNEEVDFCEKYLEDCGEHEGKTMEALIFADEKIEESEDVGSERS